MTCDFASVDFDWDNMLDTYNPPYSEAEGKAVAQLMSAAGVSVDMAYGPYVSGAMTQQAAEALVTYFDYDKGITVLYRDLYGIEEWGEVLYNQLDKYGPVVYAGANNNGGHAFVCDGYFHFNWGWSGISDGYYLLTALAPPSQGVGGSSGSFNQLIGDVTEGTYNFGIVGLLTEELYSIPVPVTVHKEPETTTLSNPTEVITPGNDPDHLPAGDVEIATEVTCEEGYYGSPLIFYLYGPEYYDDGSPMLNSVLTSNTLYLKSGEKGTASVTVNLKGSKEGTWYGGLFYDRNYATLTKWKSFMVYDDESSIDTTGSDTIGLEVEGDAATVTGAASADVEIFSAEGVRALYARATSGVSLASLPHGIYIVVITTPDGHRAVRKIIR